jgi:hypothetical protein
LQAGYDNRQGNSTIITACDCPADLKANLSYITVEPSLRFAPFKSNFYLYGGPRLAFNMDKSFTYQLGTNPAYPEQTANPEVKADFDNINKTIVSMQIGAGYDIPLSTDNNKTVWLISFRFFPTLFWSKSSFNRMEYHYCKSRRCAQVWTRKKTSTGY